jgi:hypothetical protein
VTGIAAMRGSIRWYAVKASPSLATTGARHRPCEFCVITLCFHVLSWANAGLQRPTAQGY